MADGQQKSKMLREMTLEEVGEMMDKLAIYVKGILPVDADFALFVMNPNRDTSYITSLDKFNAPEHLRKAAYSMEKNTK